MITVIDYGLGNLASVKNMIKKVGGESIITSDLDHINASTKIVLPGVGNFAMGMKNLRERNLIDVLNKKIIEDKVPVMGICLGMQLLTSHSEEGDCEGLGWIKGRTRSFKLSGVNDKIPHMGWADVVFKKDHSPITAKLPVNPRFYFVHSYYVDCENEEHVFAKSTYGIEFTCGIKSDNIYGFQFHPEKSHKFGMALFKSFVFDVNV